MLEEEIENKEAEKQPALRLRKFIFHNHVHFITCSVEEGIMLPANPLAQFLVKAAIIRAQMLHPVKISHFLVNGTHLHMIIRVDNPEDIPGFMERFKTESSHYLNRLLGRHKRTIWCSGYDSPRCKNIEDVVDKIVYTYANPNKDGLIDSIDNYPGLSSWHMFNGRQRRMFGTFISRDEFHFVDQSQNGLAFKRLSKKLAKRGKLKEIQLDPNDWLKAFGVWSKEEINEINNSIIELIKTEEIEKQEEYKKEGKSFMGREKLENQGISPNYQRKKQRGKKLWVICKDKEERKMYIVFLKELAREARDIYKEWCKGNSSCRMPIGVFAPRMPVVANLFGI